MLSVNLARPLKQGQSDAIGSQGQDVTANYGPRRARNSSVLPVAEHYTCLGESVKKTLLRFLLLVLSATAQSQELAKGESNLNAHCSRCHSTCSRSAELV